MRARMALDASRGLYLYLQTLEVALADDIVTDDEAVILEVMAKALGLPADAAGEAVAILDGDLPSPISERLEEWYRRREVGDASLYQAVLIAALDDDVITEDEWDMLDILRDQLGIQQNEHALIEESIRAQSQPDGLGVRRLERLERYLGTRTTR